MRVAVCVAALLGMGTASHAGDLDIAAPWAGTLIIPARAELGPDPAPDAVVDIVPKPEQGQPSAAAPPPGPSAQTVVPKSTHPKRLLSGFATFYDFGRITANGERFRPMGMTAAHRTLPFGTMLLVTNKRTGKSVLVRINDRGPFIRGRELDLTRGAAKAIGLDRTGLASVTMEIQ